MNNTDNPTNLVNSDKWKRNVKPNNINLTNNSNKWKRNNKFNNTSNSDNNVNSDIWERNVNNSLKKPESNKSFIKISAQDVRFIDNFNNLKIFGKLFNKFLNADFVFHDYYIVNNIYIELKKESINIENICNYLYQIYSKLISFNYFKNKNNNNNNNINNNKIDQDKFNEIMQNRFKLISLSGLNLKIIIQKYKISLPVLKTKYDIEYNDYDEYDDYDYEREREEEERYERERELCEEYGVEGYAHACYLRDRSRAKYESYFGSDSDSDYYSD